MPVVPLVKVQQCHVFGVGGPDLILGRARIEQGVEVERVLFQIRTEGGRGLGEDHVLQRRKLVANSRHLAPVQGGGGDEHAAAAEIEGAGGSVRDRRRRTTGKERRGASASPGRPR